MKTRIILLLTLLISSIGTMAQNKNTIAIGKADMEYLSLGQAVSLPVTMDNADDIVALELIVKVARGGGINADGCQLSAGRADGHQISSACIDGENNLYKVTVFSASNKPFKGNSGQLMTLDVVTGPSWLDGHTYAVTITKALLCKRNGDNVCTGFENGAISIPITPHADIKFDVTGIVTTVKKDSVNNYSLTITNNGTATTGAISMQLPDWMKLRGALMPIEPGQTATAIIAMSPTGEANTWYDGYIGVSIANGNNQILPYNVTIVSDEKGTVVFSVCDEYTYYDEAAPKVQNATIEVTNSSTGELVTTLTTGTTGTASVTLPEGYYHYRVTAEGHETYENNILVYPGQTTERTVNLSLGDGISIEYQVVETAEGDAYEIVTEATLELAVPAPQVTISAPGRLKVDTVAVGKHIDVQVTLTNRGLIKARDLTLRVPEIDGFSWKALTPINFDLRPQETSFILIRYTREAESDEGCMITWLADYTWKCGDEPKRRECYAFTSIGTNCKPCLPGNCAVASIMEDEDVIVTVKLQFNQLLTLTRQAFEGTLTITNGSDKAMEDILLNLTEKMPNGTLATDREFDISYTEFTGFSGSQSGPWALAAGETGVLKVKFIPTKYAAEIAPIDYVFGGNLTFSVDGKERHADLTDQAMTVKPTPELNLDYFMQRDVIADDAITKDVVELSEEAEFAVLISNVGYGDAENLKMVTAQPEMVENEESLFLQYSITSSQLNGQEKSLSFGKSVTTDFGTLPAQGHAYAQWWMTSSLLGHFIEYNVSYTQLTLSQNPNLSLINKIRIHELIRSIVVEGNSNANYGWAVNGEEDSQNLPDTLYLNDGTTAPITIGTASTSALEDSPFEYTLTLETSKEGWTYAKVPDPTGGKATITEVIRDNQTVVPLRNIWQTWATLPDKKRATHEDLIHIIDNCKSGTTTYTIRFTPKPATTLNIISVKLNGLEAGIDVSVSETEVQSVEVYFTDDIQELKPKALALVNQGEVVDMTDVNYAIDGRKLTIDLSQIPHNDGFWCLTVNTALIVDTEGNIGLTATPISWIEQTDKPVELNLAYNFKEAGNVKVLAEEYHGEKNIYDTPQEPVATYRYGTTLTLKVTPAYGFVFNRWSIDGNILSTEDTYDYYLSANKELKLFFDRASFNLSVSNIVDNSSEEPGSAPAFSGGTVTGGGTGLYEYGEEVELTAVPDKCHTFLGWYTDDLAAARSATVASAAAVAGSSPSTLNSSRSLKLLSTDPTYIYTVGGDYKLYPVFHRLGDVNGDSQFNEADVLLFARKLNGGPAEGFVEKEADANNDGQIDFADIEEIASSIDLPIATMQLSEGWNWVSANTAKAPYRDSYLFLDAIADKVNRLVGQKHELINDPEFGLVGALQTLDVAVGYKVQLSKGATLLQIGEAADPASTPVHLYTGWNWLGYVPTVALPIATALSGLYATNGDRLICFDHFVEYQNGLWIGDFDTMLPGEGYMYLSNKDAQFVYATGTETPQTQVAMPARQDLTTSESLARSFSAVGQSDSTVLPWQYDAHRYPDVTTIIAQTQRADTESTYTAEDGNHIIVGAFCNDECRGVGKLVGNNIFLTIHGCCGQGELITFLAYDPTMGEMLPIGETIVFEGQSLGSLSSPMVLHIQSTTTDIAQPVTRDSSTTRYYTPDGRLTNRLQQGLNIVVERDGHVRKVLR